MFVETSEEENKERKQKISQLSATQRREQKSKENLDDEKDARKIFIKKIPPSITKEQLKNMIKQIGIEVFSNLFLHLNSFI
jgi:RNA recognition motif-containing protein